MRNVESGKPPVGKRNMKDSLPKNVKLENLPPRLQKKYFMLNGLVPPNTSDDSWNGTTITFQVRIETETTFHSLEY